MTYLPYTKHTLRFGSLDWKGASAPAGWRMHALAEGADLGNAVPVEQTLAHQLLDGSVSRRKGYDNRTATFDVMVEADDSIALAQGGAALDLACDNPTTLLFTPPDGLGAATYFDVVTAKADWLFDDLDELRNQRRYRVTINCLPFGRSAESVTDSVVPVESPAAEATVNACDSLTGFTGLNGSTASIDTSVKFQGTGSVKLTGQTREAVWTYEGMRPRETGTVELTGLSLGTPATRPYISFKAYVGNSQNPSATLHANGIAATFVSATSVSSTWMMFTFRTAVTDTITTLKMSTTITGDFGVEYHESTNTWVNVPSSWVPRIDNILRNGVAVSTPRQSMRSVTIDGSARTQGSLAISHPTNGLGDVLVLSTPSFATGFTPDLMKWCATSTTSSSTSISGRVKTFSNARVPFEFPAAQLTPGSYQLIGYLQTGDLDDDEAPAGVVIRSSTKVGSTTLSTDEHVQRIRSTGDGVFEFVDCGPITLPTTNVPAGSDAIVRLEIVVVDMVAWLSDKNTTGSFGSSFQEFYLVPLVENTALNIVECGGTGTATRGTANSRLWLDSATLATRNPSIWMGTQVNRTDAYSAASEAMRWTPLSFLPGELLLFVANSGGTSASVTLTYDMSWQGLAAK